ncbi:hypothetical protein HPB47_009130, partial [Ixodes persulcatus]
LANERGGPTVGHSPYPRLSGRRRRTRLLQLPLEETPASGGVFKGALTQIGQKCADRGDVARATRPSIAATPSQTCDPACGGHSTADNCDQDPTPDGALLNRRRESSTLVVGLQELSPVLTGRRSSRKRAFEVSQLAIELVTEQPGFRRAVAARPSLPDVPPPDSDIPPRDTFFVSGVRGSPSQPRWSSEGMDEAKKNGAQLIHSPGSSQVSSEITAIPTTLAPSARASRNLALFRPNFIVGQTGGSSALLSGTFRPAGALSRRRVGVSEACAGQLSGVPPPPSRNARQLRKRKRRPRGRAAGTDPETGAGTLQEVDAACPRTAPCGETRPGLRRLASSGAHQANNTEHPRDSGHLYERRRIHSVA